MSLLALLALQGPQVTEAAGGLSPDAKWILIALGSGVLMVAGFLGRITFALLPSAKEALLGIAKLPASIDGVKAELSAVKGELSAVKDGMAQEMRETRIALGVFKGEVKDELEKLDLSFEGLAQEVRDRRVSEMAKSTSAALALATGTLPENPLPDLSDEDAPSRPVRAPGSRPRSPGSRAASSPTLEGFSVPSERRR